MVNRYRPEITWLTEPLFREGVGYTEVEALRYIQIYCEQIKKTYHHEVFHAIEKHFFSEKVSFYRAHLMRQVFLSTYQGYWSLKYGRGNENWRKLPSRPEGYASTYGTYNRQEDKATIATELMVPDSKFWEIVSNDRVLREKVGTVISMYDYVSGGVMNEAFFLRLASKN